MKNKWIKRLFPVFALLLLAPWPVAYAHEYSAGESDRSTVEITAAEASVAPSITVFGKAIGGVEPGDLFYIDAAGNPADIQITLYITNADRLSRSYSHMVLRVGMYVESGDGGWESLSEDNGGPIGDSFITMRDARVSFTVPGYAKYKMTIDGGSYYCTSAGNEGLAPEFYLSAD